MSHFQDGFLGSVASVSVGAITACGGRSKVWSIPLKDVGVGVSGHPEEVHIPSVGIDDNG